jgi:hypothetical protein
MSKNTEQVAAELVRDVVENGRVAADGRGGVQVESLRVEVEFEARERGYSDERAADIAAEAAKMEDAA